MFLFVFVLVFVLFLSRIKRRVITLHKNSKEIVFQGRTADFLFNDTCTIFNWMISVSYDFTLYIISAEILVLTRKNSDIRFIVYKSSIITSLTVYVAKNQFANTCQL